MSSNSVSSFVPKPGRPEFAEPPNPIRAHYKSAEELAQLGAAVARGETVRLPEFEPMVFDRRLKENARVILTCYKDADLAARAGDTVTPAAQWLLDNYYVVDQSMQQTKRDLPRRFVRELSTTPVTADGVAMPRILAMAWLYVAHTDSVFSLKTLTAIAEGFQSVEPLHIGELWALPSAVRYVLIENTRRLSLRVDRARRMRTYANEIADKITVSNDPENLKKLLDANTNMALENTFATQLLYRLRDGSKDAGAAVAWLEQELEKNGSDSEDAIIKEHTRQSTGGVSMGNIIRSLKAIDDVDWTAWFETISPVDAVLREQSDFDDLDFRSRNAYRNVIEKIAKRSTKSEIDIASKAISLAREASASKDPSRQGAFDMGYFLAGEGRLELERECEAVPSLPTRMLRAYRAFGLASLVVPIAIVASILLFFLSYIFDESGFSDGVLLVFLLLAIFPSIEAAIGFCHWLIPKFLPPTRLIGYEYKDGPPADAQTLVAVPTLINSKDSVDEQIRNLEVHYLTNPRGEVYFALLTDWVDSKVEQSKSDMEILDYARERIDALNQHYTSSHQRFFLLHRRRLFNPNENCWMGWERKRGKLHELNLLLRGDQDTTYFPGYGALPQTIRFVMTLDADTRLTADSVNRLVGKLNHPLNRAQLDPKTGRVVRGYGILQPRVTPSLTTGDEASFLQRVFSVNRGIDPYVFAVSDVYQDLLDEGSFTGKGLYDVDVFEAALKGRIGENSILSHDLLEGGYARSALVTDVEVVEDYPTGYNVDVSRHHRWARGDWQLLPYLFGHKSGVTPLTRWKMLDNLRRSLSPIFWVLASIIGWTFLPLRAASFWQFFLVASMFVAPTLSLVGSLLPRSRQVSFKGHFQAVLNEILSGAADVALRITFIAHSAYLMADAIIRTLYRLTVSRKKMLEWRAAAQAKMASSDTLTYYVQLMWPAMVIAVIAIALPLQFRSPAWFIAAPFAAIWFLSPAIAWLVSRSAKPQDELWVRSSDKSQLRRIARRTWHFFDTFANAEHNHLPPDNFQEDPLPVVANRTSPTNIGMYLLSTVAARDFGWIGFDETLERIGDTLTTIEKMEKHRGHLYNWYETTTLRPLMPLYVSAVDSGNLAGHLVTLSSALEIWAEAPSVYLQSDLEGILDVNDILEEWLGEVPDDRRVLRPLRRRLEDRIAHLRAAVTTIGAEPETASFRTINLPVIANDILRLTDELNMEIDSAQSLAVKNWAKLLLKTCQAHTDDAIGEHETTEPLRARLQALATRARKLAFEMDFSFLERKERRLLSIGYRVEENELDASCYDLMASEARLTSLFAIAKGDVPVDHWFKLGRLTVPVGWKGALLSWSGSMFEYLMPPLVMREPLGGLLDQTNKLVVKSQIDYAAKLDVPWGISESAYNARDPEMNYQYTNFGVPKLGLKRGLTKNTVIAPYASLLASQYRPADAVANLQKLQDMGALGEFGFYDAVDFTRARVREGEKYAVVRNYMAHHHGMSIVAVCNVVFEGRMRERFHSDPVIEAAELLLQEKAPRDIPLIQSKLESNIHKVVDTGMETYSVRTIANPVASPRATQMMSNGHYSVMVTATGSGYSRWNGLAVTRFQPDATNDGLGTFLFLRDLESGHWWPATGSPTRIADDATTTIFTDDKAEFLKTVGTIQSHVECVVTSDADGEGRRITIMNNGPQDRLIEITSYAELALTTDDTDAGHPAFSKMFVETEIAGHGDTIFASRRKRSSGDPDIHVAHFVADGLGAAREAEAETDRRAFIGRGRTLLDPVAFDPDSKLSGSQGFVLDPVAALRCKVRVPARKKVTLVFWTLASDNRSNLQEAVQRFRHPDCFSREFSLSWTRSQVRLQHIGISPDEAADFQRFATYLLYPDSSLRLPPETIASGLGSQSTLWPMSISGDFPIFALRIDDEADIGVLLSVLKAQEYWRSKGLIADVVIINERSFSYAQDFQRALEGICENSRARGRMHGPREHIFAVRREQMNDASYNTLLASARIVMHAQNGSLTEQLKRLEELELVTMPRLQGRAAGLLAEITSEISEEIAAIIPHRTAVAAATAVKSDDLAFWNGFGGFDMTTGDYVVRLTGRDATPQPWINVISNPVFGFHVSAEGAGFTWSGNSRDYQLTPWSNDPVVNRTGEAIYVADLDSGKAFSAVAAVLRNESAVYEARHAHGYSQFSARHDTLELVLTHTVDTKEPVRVSRLTITNHSSQTRRLRVYGYAEWVLGTIPSKTAPFIVPSRDEKLDALFVSNPYGVEYGGRVAFFGSSAALHSASSDRTEFLGKSGSVEKPDAVMKGKALSNHVQAAHDPCAALAVDIEIPAGQSHSIAFFMGDAANADEARRVLTAQKKEAFATTLEKNRKVWTDFFGGLQVKTPDPAFDLMVNHWLPYQSLACRIWARTAFYQASGAFGCRDQLQDTLSLLLLDPSLARKQILNVAGRQFVEGDIQHWWLPGTGAGVRTLISDDVVWLGYAVSHYIDVTSDRSVLDEPVAFIEGRALEPGEHDAYFEPTKSAEIANVYEHCARALDLAIARTGVHGLPLILTGDWNDGMNRVGEEGKGESVWLGWFLAKTLTDFLPIASSRKDEARTRLWSAHLQSLKKALEKDGWDGEWYRRGYFDDGAPLGSKTSDECQIDSIAQSWSVLTGLGDPERARQAMGSVGKHLVDEEAKIIRLFTPPFEKTTHDPGYIKSYPPGVRENGGQYTHAATWAVLAMAKLGNTAEAYRWFQMLNPISHSLDRDDAEAYRVEPYVIAADIYSVDPMRGRGGWTWYTGSAGWMYRVATEGILGLTRKDDRLFIQPALPPQWDSFSADLRFGEATYAIEVRAVAGASGASVSLNGKTLAKGAKDGSEGIPIETTGSHRIVVEMPVAK